MPGAIRVDGRLVNRDSKEIQWIRTRVSMVFQRFNLFRRIAPVLENVIEGPVYVKKEDRKKAVERAEELLQQVGWGTR